jgi:hypothetical protein
MLLALAAAALRCITPPRQYRDFLGFAFASSRRNNAAGTRATIARARGAGGFVTADDLADLN